MPDTPISFQVFDIRSHWLNEDEKRFDAKYYAEDVIAAKVTIDDLTALDIPIKKVSDCVDDIYWPGRFKRVYKSEGSGTPFLTPKEVFLFRPTSRKYIVDIPEDIYVNRDWILITRSGTIGRCLISPRLFEDLAISDDLIRILPNDSLPFGYLYTYLNTWIGQTFLTKNQYGATVKHIEPHHVKQIPIPRFPEIEDEIHNRIVGVQRLREEAQALLFEAERRMYSELQLPEVVDDLSNYYGGEVGSLVKAFEIKSQNLENRFDASYHIPAIRTIEENLEGINVPLDRLKNHLDEIRIPPRFKRPYVNDPKYGSRYIRPSDLPVIKPLELLYLAKKFKNSDLYVLNEGEILVVTDGTIGWVSLVTGVLAGTFGSNNFARLTTSSLNRGYLLIYLQSPYGQYQLKREIFGGVIDHLIEEHITNVIIPIPDEETQNRVGNLAIRAYTLKDVANQIEQATIRDLEIFISEKTNN